MSGNNKKNGLSVPQLVGIIVGAILVMWGVGLLTYTLGILLHPGTPNAWSTMWGTMQSSRSTYCIVVVLGIVAYCAVQIKQGSMRNIFAKTAQSVPLTRSATDKRVAGIAGGVARWIGCGSVSVRVMFLLLLTVSPAIIIISYIALAFVLPQE